MFPLIILLCCGVTDGASAVLVRSEPATYHIRATAEVDAGGVAPELVTVSLPLPVSCEYQDVATLPPTQTSSQWPNDGGKFVTVTSHAGDPPPKIEMCFDVTLYNIDTDWSRIENVDANDKTLTELTHRVGDLIDPTEPRIVEIAKRLRSESRDRLSFARNAYAYVADNFKYLNPNTGIHPLAKILDDGGADCGNLSSIWISILRSESIPARHVVCRRPDGSCHVWAEFWLGGHWIPADVTADLGRGTTPKHFGQITDRCVVLTRGLRQPLPTGRGTTNVDCIQNGAYWFFGLPQNAKLPQIKTTFAERK
ncbi:MAG: transglutaminase-like domain-containing protein [Thermoguttaceae bacterium]